MANCPVCGTEYSYGTINVCQTCGWDLTPYPEVLGGIPKSVLQKEQTKLTWAREMWVQLQLQSKIMSFEARGIVAYYDWAFRFCLFRCH
ncbi:MAG: hypothetical protein GDA48_24525 [Hormoscilla sp. GM102CHS1]|nr:hypothetical protein [Hormoscilla sp. GM102CHS1]